MSNYHRNKERAKTRQVGATKTDQSAAPGTDINIIMKNHAIHGTAPGSAKAPLYGDFSNIPDNLRDMIELGKSIEGHRQQLPTALQDMTIQELVNANPEQLHQRIKEEGVYNERHKKLPPHLKSLGRNELIGLTEPEFHEMIAPRQKETPPPQKETK